MAKQKSPKNVQETADEIIETASADAADREDETAVPNPAAPTEGPKIRMRGQQQMLSHVYKLGVAKMMKNVAMDDSEPRWEPAEHVHFFRTYDSQGQAMEYTPAIGGHFHEVRKRPGQTPDSPDEIVSVGPPLKWVKQKIGPKRYARVAVPVGSHDQHTHDARYLDTEVVKLDNKINPEYAKLVAQVESGRPGPVEGVTG